MKLEPSPKAASANTSVLTVRLSPAFKWTFLSILGLTVLCLPIGCTLVGLTIRTARDMTPQENVILDLCTSTFKLGFGAIIGLFGGKAL